MAGTAWIASTPWTGNTWLNAITWGTQWSSGGSTAVVSAYIAGQPLSEWVSDGGGGWVWASQPYSQETAAMMTAMASFEAVCNIDFRMVGSQANADLVWATVDTVDAGGADTLGWANPPGEGFINGEAQGLVAINYELYSPAAGVNMLVQGGSDFCTFVHELGHAVGLAHPHDDGGGSTLFPGVTFEDDLGIFNMNQGIYTMMSYNSGSHTGPQGLTPSDTFGHESGPMALDVAALQFMYGANMAHRTGNDTYSLPSANQAGTSYSCIWDAGGIDRIVGASAGSNTIDLRAATLEVGPGGGGWVSQAAGVHGGLTIAKGAVIENATGGALADMITGNQASNVLVGLGGSDMLIGLGGNDRLDGGAGTDWLEGGAGNDTYIVAAAGDTIVEGAGAGTDLVQAAVTISTLAANVENLLLTGSANLNGTGNALANRLTGNRGVNKLQGGTGDDTLDGAGGADALVGGTGKDRLLGGAGVDSVTGGLGNDVFVFNSRSEAGDRITDFRNITGDNDILHIDASSFGGGLVAGAQLRASHFQIANDNLLQGKADASIRFIFEKDTTKLWFDSNGTSTGGLTMVADLDAAATMTSADIFLV